MVGDGTNINLDVVFRGFWTFLAVQWLRLCSSTAEGMGVIPGQGTQVPHAVQHEQKKRERERKKEATVSDSVDLGEGQGILR